MSIPNPYEGRIRRLEDKLWTTRHAIIKLMPEEIQRILESYYRCETRKDAISWYRSTVEKIIDLAKPRPAEEMGNYVSLSPRAVCPLCGESSMNMLGIDGFAVPEGLRRHLEGSHNSQQCGVFQAAEALAHDYFNENSSRKPWRNHV